MPASRTWRSCASSARRSRSSSTTRSRSGRSSSSATTSGCSTATTAASSTSSRNTCSRCNTTTRAAACSSLSTLTSSSAGTSTATPSTTSTAASWCTATPPGTRPGVRHWACRSPAFPRLLLRQHPHRPLEACERGRVHTAVHQLLDDRDRLAVGPDLLGLGIEPDALGVHVGDALDPRRARLLVEVLDRAARLQDLIGAHRGVADEDHLVVVPVLVQQVPGTGALGVAPAVVLPHEVIQAVVEVEELEVLELGLCGREQLCGELDVVVHRAADEIRRAHV